MRTGVVRPLAYAAAMLVLACCLYADEAATLIDAAKKGMAKNDMSIVEPNFTKALDLLDPSDPRYNSTALEYSNYLKTNKMVEKAELTLRKAMERQQTGPVQPIQRIPILMALADVETQVRDAAALESAQVELVKSWSAVVGPDQPVVANNLVRLAQTYERTGKFPDAVKAIEQALPILKKSFGNTDASVGYAEGILSRAQIRTGDKDGAAQSARNAKDILSKVFDPNALPAGNGITFPKIQKHSEPRYPEEAKKSKIQGSITLSLTIGEDGVPRDIHVLIPLGAGADASAIEAVKEWRFEPGRKNDDPVPVRATVDVNIRLIT